MTGQLLLRVWVCVSVLESAQVWQQQLWVRESESVSECLQLCVSVRKSVQEWQ